MTYGGTRSRESGTMQYPPSVISVVENNCSTSTSSFVLFAKRPLILGLFSAYAFRDAYLMDHHRIIATKLLHFHPDHLWCILILGIKTHLESRFLRQVAQSEAASALHRKAAGACSHASHIQTPPLVVLPFKHKNGFVKLGVYVIEKYGVVEIKVSADSNCCPPGLLRGKEFIA
ncbi:hypothetical protein Ccrd_005352, partial [Cynara cardunculus var. scolymus]